MAQSGTGRRRRGGGPPEPEHPAGSPAATDPEPDPESVARAILLRQLAAAPRSRQQLAEKLAERGVADDLAGRLLDRFTEVGLIDDAQYAAMLVRSRHASRGLARRALAVELRRKGVGDEDAATALDQVDDAAEEEAARELLRRRFGSATHLDPQVLARRAMAMLGRKGYPPGLSARLVREMVDDRGGGPGESWEATD